MLLLIFIKPTTQNIGKIANLNTFFCNELINMAQPIISNGKTANKYLEEKKLMDANSIKPIVITKNASNFIR